MEDTEDLKLTINGGFKIWEELEACLLNSSMKNCLENVSWVIFDPNTNDQLYKVDTPKNFKISINELGYKIKAISKATDGVTIKTSDTPVIQMSNKIKENLQSILNRMPSFTMPNTLDSDTQLNMKIDGAIVQVLMDSDMIQELNLLNSVADISQSKESCYYLLIKDSIFSDDVMELKFQSVKERDCMGLMLMFWQGFLLQFIREKRPQIRENKKLGFKDPLSLYEKIADVFHYYYIYTDYRGNLLESYHNSKIKTECFDKLKNYASLENRNEILEKKNEKYDFELQQFDKQLYDLKSSKILQEEERFFLIKEVERLVDLERELNYRAEAETKKEEIVRKIDFEGMKLREQDLKDDIVRLQEELTDEMEKGSGLLEYMEQLKANMKGNHESGAGYTGDKVDKKYKQKYLFYRTKVEVLKQENREYREKLKKFDFAYKYLSQEYETLKSINNVFSNGNHSNMIDANSIVQKLTMDLTHKMQELENCQKQQQNFTINNTSNPLIDETFLDDKKSV